MGFFQKLIGRIPIVLILFGIVLYTGSYRGHEASSSYPTIGIGLAVVGVVAYGGLAYSRSN